MTLLRSRSPQGTLCQLRLVFCTLALISPACFSSAASAQTLATGDGRGTITEPTFPAVCSQVQADLTISAGEPSSELNTATDTGNIQTALKNCPAGKAVELVANGANNAFVIAPIFVPPGVTLLVDGGVTVFGSRNPADYQIAGAASGQVCGTLDTEGTACNPLISLGQNTVGGGSGYTGANVTGLMGYGVINGRGGDKLITINGSTVTPGSQSWWDLATAASGDLTQDCPIMVGLTNIVNAQLYKITLWNSPHFHVKLTGKGSLTQPTNFTVWGMKLLTPFSARNTDGVDPTGVVNMSLLNSVIGDGDDESAISGSSFSANFTYNNDLLSSGHGISIGSITRSNVTNVLVNNVNFSGQAKDGNQEALRIKSFCGDGGTVSQVTYENVCIQNVAAAIDIDPYYDPATSTSTCPAFGTVAAPITYQNVYILTPSIINLQGLFNGTTTNLSNIALNNVFVNSSTLDLKSDQGNDTTATPSYDTISLTGSYFPAALGTLNTATHATMVTETNNGTLAGAFSSPCGSVFPKLVGELYANSATANNLNQAFSVTLPATITLNAMVQPTNSQTTYTTYTGAAAPTAAVQFLDGTTVVGTGTLSANGTLASATITNPTAGTHTYTANYVGDTNYPAFSFGSLVVTVTGGSASQLAFSTAPPSTLTYGTPAGTVSVALQDGAGNMTASTAAVTLTVIGSGGYSQTYSANAVSGTATFSLPAVLPVGSYTYTASATSLTSAVASESVGPATLTVTATPASRLFGNPNPSFAFTIAGFVNGDPTTVVSGAPVITTTAVRSSPAASYPTTVALGTLAAANYNFVLVGGTLQVTGGAPQVVFFTPLPNFASGGSYQLTARTSSGLPATYTVTGPAQVSGSMLNVQSPGLVTVTASSPGDQDYAAATGVSQSFTAQ